MEHPNLNEADRQTLTTFCTLFELDWRGDQSIENKNEFLATNPVYLKGSNLQGYGEVGNFEMSAMMRQACLPYVDRVVKLLKKQ